VVGYRSARRAGFTLLELVVVICLVGILASVALERLLRYQEIAEKTAMEATIGALRSAQTLQVASRILSGGLASVAKLAEENPIEWLASPPPGYLGALYDPPIAEVPKASWYFDLKTTELVYRPQRTRFLTPAPQGNERIHFRVVVRLESGEGSAVRGLSELTIRPVAPGRWLPEF
jgi:general secretion pathway protein G